MIRTLTLLFCLLSTNFVPQQRTLDRQFLEAVEQRDVAKINSLLSGGANVNARNSINGYFALQYAINWPDINLVKLLLDKGADVNLADDSGDTALIEAAGRSGPEYAAIAKLLIARGANIHANKDKALLGAAESGDPEIVRLLLAKGARVNARHEDDRNNTVLMAGANGSSVETIAMLLDAGADIKARNGDGKTALMIASSLSYGTDPRARLPMIDLLIKKGSDLNAKDKRGKSALLHSVTQYLTEGGGVKSHLEVVQLLLERGADIQASDEHGYNSLMIAVDVWRGSLDIPRLLVEKGINLNAQNKQGTTALMIAAAGGKLEAVKLLLEKGADPNLKDADGATALDFAAFNGKDDVAKFLFAKGVISKSSFNNEGGLQKAVINAALLSAASVGELDEIKKQLAVGADINTQSRAGQTPLMLAIEYSYGRTAVPLFLIEQGADVNAADPEGNTALMFAIQRNTHELAQVLVERKAKAYVRNKEGRTPLHLAAAGLRADVIKMLLATKPEVLASSAGVDVWKVEVNGRDASGKTPLMLAANNGSFVPTEAMEALVKGGAEIDAQDPQGDTALMISAASGSMSGVEFLLSKRAAVNLKNAKGQTALSIAKTIHTIRKYSNAAELERRIVKMLIDAGAK